MRGIKRYAGTCEPCYHNGEKTKAIKLAPQSADAGKTITWIAVCRLHLWGWWDGADFGPMPFKSIKVEKEV